MGLKETAKAMRTLLEHIAKDMDKVEAGNKAAAQRVRTSTIRFEKTAKLFRKESVKAAKSGELKRLKANKKKATKPAAKPAKAKAAAPKKAASKSKVKVKVKVKSKSRPVAKTKKKVAKPRTLARKRSAGKVKRSSKK